MYCIYIDYNDAGHVKIEIWIQSECLNFMKCALIQMINLNSCKVLNEVYTLTAKT